LLAQVYIELLGERQATLGLAGNAQAITGARREQRAKGALQRPTPLPPRLTAADQAAHAAFVETLGPNAIWKRA
jgi:DNA polymerase III subunit epsilon